MQEIGYLARNDARACENGIRSSHSLTSADEILQITSRASHVRGELKTKVQLIIEHYGFESGQHKQTIKRNRELAEELKEGYNFVYSVCDLNCGASSH
jgi:hypothetical protein